MHGCVNIAFVMASFLDSCILSCVCSRLYTYVRSYVHARASNGGRMTVVVIVLRLCPRGSRTTTMHDKLRSGAFFLYRSRIIGFADRKC